MFYEAGMVAHGTSVLERQRQADHCGLMARQSSLQGESEANERSCLKQKVVGCPSLLSVAVIKYSNLLRGRKGLFSLNFQVPVHN